MSQKNNLVPNAIICVSAASGARNSGAPLMPVTPLWIIVIPAHGIAEKSSPPLHLKSRKAFCTGISTPQSGYSQIANNCDPRAFHKSRIV
jgi:hypothetical protein